MSLIAVSFANDFLQWRAILPKFNCHLNPSGHLAKLRSQLRVPRKPILWLFIVIQLLRCPLSLQTHPSSNSTPQEKGRLLLVNLCASSITCLKLLRVCRTSKSVSLHLDGCYLWSREARLPWMNRLLTCTSRVVHSNGATTWPLQNSLGQSVVYHGNITPARTFCVNWRWFVLVLWGIFSRNEVFWCVQIYIQLHKLIKL